MLGRLKVCDGEPFLCSGVLPALGCLPKGRAGAPVSPSWACLVTGVWHGTVVIAGAPLESLPGAPQAGGACTAFPTEEGQQAL